MMNEYFQLQYLLVSEGIGLSGLWHWRKEQWDGVTKYSEGGLLQHVITFDWKLIKFSLWVVFTFIIAKLPVIRIVLTMH